MKCNDASECGVYTQMNRFVLESHGQPNRVHHGVHRVRRRRVASASLGELNPQGNRTGRGDPAPPFQDGRPRCFVIFDSHGRQLAHQIGLVPLARGRTSQRPRMHETLRRPTMN